ncbi:MAG TPA: SDR family NAD(P)-dependent oxidoreductase [Smithellaceae bacterium]|nr:SDR family NAD(P)-dependent oxidoreductase [Smithellaceae bacterium]
MNRIKGKTVLITGASSGIGKACAEQCAGCQANLILAARRFDRLQTLKNDLEKMHGIVVFIHRLDVRVRQDVENFVSQLAARDICPDILINNAGLSAGLDKLHEGNFDDWERMIDTNVKGLLYVSRAVIPLMIKAGKGHVVNIGSIAGHQVYPCGNVYNATKFAVRALTEAMNIDLSGTDIRVSCVSPGAANTEFSTVRFHGDTKKADMIYTGYKPLSADDIADAVLYILNAPEHVNIQNILITPTAQRNIYCVDRRKPD